MSFLFFSMAHCGKITFIISFYTFISPCTLSFLPIPVWIFLLFGTRRHPIPGSGCHHSCVILKNTTTWNKILKFQIFWFSKKANITHHYHDVHCTCAPQLSSTSAYCPVLVWLLPSTIVPNHIHIFVKFNFDLFQFVNHLDDKINLLSSTPCVDIANIPMAIITTIIYWLNNKLKPLHLII